MPTHLRVHTEAKGMLAGLYPEAFQFPGGEWHLRNIPPIPTDQGAVTLIADVRGADPNDLVKAALWADVAHRANFDDANRVDYRFVLMCPYLPGARADKGTPRGASVYAHLIRSMSPHRVIALDPHSPEIIHVLGLGGGVRIADHNPLIVEAVDGITFDGLICPDAGAKERVHNTALRLGGLDVYHAEKHRDFDTGKLSGFKMVDVLPRSGKYLVVDDICDGGGTFMGLAQATGLSRDQLGLWVTHGIFSGRADHLRSDYRWISTTDSHPGSNRIGVATCIVPCFMTMLDSF